MKITITSDEHTWTFQLLETSGEAIGSKSPLYAGHITVALHSAIGDVSLLYRMLRTLTANYWHGFIVHDARITDHKPELTNYLIRLPKEGERGRYVCEVGYKVYVPMEYIEDYEVELGSENEQGDP